MPLDGTIEFFGRVQSLLRPTDIVIDLGAGRGAWYYNDKCAGRRRLRDIRSTASRVVALDVDPVVLTNPTATDNAVIVDGCFPVEDNFADAIVADYVLEHVIDTGQFIREIDRVLKPGGFFFARTPHKLQYISLIARCVANRNHADVLSRAQPTRRPEDVFPTAYKLNTLSAIRDLFEGYEDHSYLYASEPAYYFGKQSIYRLLAAAHRFLPSVFVSNIFVFLKKPAG